MYQPLSPSVPVTDGVITGAVVSILTVSVAVWSLPALSRIEQLMACTPSPETLALQGDEVPLTESALPLSVHVGAPARPLPPSLAEIESAFQDRHERNVTLRRSTVNMDGNARPLPSYGRHPVVSTSILTPAPS